MGFIINPYNFATSTIFSDNFTTSANWTQAGSTIVVNTGSTRIDYDGQINGVAGSTLVHDMGAGILGSTWTLRFPWNVTTATTNSGLNQPNGHIGISDNIPTSPTTPNDFIGIRWVSEPLTYYANSIDGGTQTNTSFTTVPSVSQKYIEIKRLTATTGEVNLYSDSAYTTLVESKSMTFSSSVTGLRYIIFFEVDGVGYTSGGGRLVSQVNGVLSVT